MREGKVSQAVLDRSILRVIKNKRSLVELGGEIGRDASILNIEKKHFASIDTRTVCVKSLCQLDSMFVHIVNHIACAGSFAEAVIISILFPKNGEENYLKEIMETIERQCLKHNMQIMGGHTSVSSDISVPIVTLTGIGTKSVIDCVPKAKADQDIVITKWIALEGTAYAAIKYKDMLKNKLPNYLIEAAEHFYEFTVTSREALYSYEAEASVVHDAGEGGIFAALWEFAQASNVGIVVDIKKIPIRQETVEICEQLKINPYELLSTGALIIAAENGEKLCRQLMDKGICAVNVGRTTDDNDRIILNDDEVRHLTPASQDYIYKI